MPVYVRLAYFILLTLGLHVREGNSSPFVCLSTSDFEDGGVFTFETGINVN